ncbi:epidermis-specific secreted glycoprotein ep1 [Quercus suber]|uniref:Epidermis-specific secreted glycoprotein ep1 n=1 Tax=Quercus suber TaxID=58331 RepID=A0AAW0LL26_QUESU
MKSENNATSWQSFDHPTDTLVVGQNLVLGQQLTSEGGLFSLSLTTYGLFAYFNFYPPQPYYSYTFSNSDKISYAQFQTVSFDFIKGNRSFSQIIISSSQYQTCYMRLGLDGPLESEVDDILTSDIGFCGHPTVCGNYSICTTNDQCSCPGPRNGTNYFQQIQERRPDLGWSLVTQLSCEASKYHILLELQNGDVNVESDLDYFFFNPTLRSMRTGVNNQEEYLVVVIPLSHSVLSGLQ